ncbi:TB2/DP1, HVA22 family-domain-containing protein [Staphylotrichum tortipilum]|uniref:Protein YOP1 n=1 Tax=Staphylotrichum tortipilum TaxID=2831512 RepID=A0AAN6RPH6_9PEZI|nr:TB2/DP1, HVA22 family-domain-containing protein [Staphylotrichum longicolle]
MFDIFAKLLSSAASFLFPLFASYKALKTGDPTQLTPWLMYWVVLACVLLVESWTEWFLVWIPFYAYIRLLFLLYLVLPQTHGARDIYLQYIHPRLEENETAIEEFIASAHARLRSAGIAYLKRAIELLRTNVLGLPPSPEAAAAAAPPEPQTPQSYTQSLLARFTLPSTAGWNTSSTAPANSPSAQPAGGLTNDFFSLLASAVSAATTTTATSSKSPTPPSPTTAASNNIIPPSLQSASPADRLTFISAQRERLRFVLSALDREEARHQTQAPEQDDNGKGIGKRRSLSEQSVASGLSKSRSEADFEKLDAPSGAEEEGEEGMRKRAGTESQQGSGGWMPWGWGGGGEGGRSSGVEK